MADPNPGLDSGSELPKELELENPNPTDPPVDPQDLDAQGADPLDDIKDPEKRAEAKKHRAIARRQGKPPETPPKVETPAPDAPKPKEDALTKADFYKINERKAVASVTTDPEVKANWQGIAALYVPRRGKDTPEDIAEDIKDAIILFNARNGIAPKDESKGDLTVTPVVKNGGGPIDKTPPQPKPLPNFHLPTKPQDWYPKKT